MCHSKQRTKNIAQLFASMQFLYVCVCVDYASSIETRQQLINGYFFLSFGCVFVKPLYDETFSPAIYIRNSFAYRKRNHWSIKRTASGEKKKIKTLCGYSMLSCLLEIYSHFFSCAPFLSLSILMLFIVIRFVSIIFLSNIHVTMGTAIGRYSD